MSSIPLIPGLFGQADDGARKHEYVPTDTIQLLFRRPSGSLRVHNLGVNSPRYWVRGFPRYTPPLTKEERFNWPDR